MNWNSRRKAAASLLLPLVLLLWLCFFHLSLPAEETALRWRWSNPRPHGNNINDLAQSGGLYVQAGERGQLYTSFDLNRWTPRESGTTNALRAVTFFGGRIIVTGENGTVLWADTVDQFQPGTELQTADWLEGVAAKGIQLVVAVGDNGSVYTSTNAVNWVKRPQTFTTWLRGVAYGPLPNVFVAVGENGFIATSSDGLDWTLRTSNTTQHLNRVAWIGDRFWAVGDGGVTRTSVNGQTWTTETTGAANALNSTAGSTSERLVAGASEVRLREDSVWSNELDSNQTSPPPIWTYLSSLWDGRLFLLGGRSGVVVEGFRASSTEPVTWTQRQDSIRSWFWDVLRAPDFYLAAGDKGMIASSDNGVDWFPEPVPASVSSTIFLGVGGSASRLVAVGNQGAIITSTNGRNWTAVEPRPTLNDLQGVAALGDLLVVTGGEGTIFASLDGQQWTLRTTPTTEFLSGVTAFPGGLVAVGRNGTILTSPDGTTWTVQSSNTTNWIYRVRYGNGQLIAVGQNGTILTSPDGSSWTSRSSGTTQWLNDVTFAGNRYFAVGLQGTVLSSPDGITWTNIGVSTRKSLYSAVGHDGQLVVVGVEGTILRCRVTPDLTPPVFLEYSRTTDGNLFLMSGRTDQQFILDSSADLLNWMIGPTLEFFDSSGTLLFLQTAPDAPLDFFRARLLP